MLSVKQVGIKHHFWVFGMTRPGIEPRPLERLANILIIMPISGLFKMIPKQFAPGLKEVYQQIFAGLEVQTMWNLKKNVWFVRRGMF